MSVQKSSLAGFLGTCSTLVSTVIVFPFERLTAIIQTNDCDLYACLALLRRGGYYTGVETTIIAQLVTAQVFFFSHTYFKSIVHRLTKESVWTDFVNSVAAAFVTAVVTNPVWLVNSRVMLKQRAPGNILQTIHIEATNIVRKEGYLGFFRGVVSAMGTVFATGLQFMFYEYSRRLLLTRISRKKVKYSGNHIYFLYLGMISKVFATVLTFPFETINRRRQNGGDEPIAAFSELYNGISSRLAQMSIQNGIKLYLFEYLKSLTRLS